MTPIEEAKLAIETATIGVKMYEALGRLLKNRDFQLIVERGYLEGEAVRLTHLLASPLADNREGTIEQLVAISHLADWFRVQRIAGQQARKSLDENTAELQFLMSEEDNPANGE